MGQVTANGIDISFTESGTGDAGTVLLVCGTGQPAAMLTGGFGPGGQHGQYSASASWIAEDHLTELAEIEVPVLVVANQFDPIFPAPGVRAVVGAVPDGTYVEVPGASHIGIDPDSLEPGRNTVIKFLAAH